MEELEQEEPLQATSQVIFYFKVFTQLKYLIKIFLRELISNATDATVKLKYLTNIGEAKVEYGNPMIEIKIDKENKKLHIIDQGIGMTKDEIEKYINEIAFSGAEEFLEKYKDESGDDKGIIGHFGLGFYSSFMVAERVELLTKSAKPDHEAVRWSCDGSPNFNLTGAERTDAGTDVSQTHPRAGGH